MLELEHELRDLIAPYAGEIGEARPARRGFSADFTGVVETDRGTMFLKAVRADGREVESLHREMEINPYVREVAPALRWAGESDSWHALLFDYVHAGTSSFLPASPDLPTIVRAVDSIGRIECPAVAEAWPETRWNRFTDDLGVKLFAGGALLHTDINPSNILIQPDGVAWVVDWSWPTRGAAFIDAACLVIQLVASGHSSAQAEEWANGISAWRGADPAALDAFAAASVRMYRRAEERFPASWRTAMTEAVSAWADHRGAMPSAA